MGWFLDGRVTAVVGTHTHVPTADARLLPKGTAYISDIGMTGPRDSIIGFSIETRPAALPDPSADPLPRGRWAGRLQRGGHHGRSTDRACHSHRPGPTPDRGLTPRAMSSTAPRARPAPPLAAIVGPTASGKSDLAMALARRLPVEILVADSRQVYRGDGHRDRQADPPRIAPPSRTTCWTWCTRRAVHRGRLGRPGTTAAPRDRGPRTAAAAGWRHRAVPRRAGRRLRPRRQPGPAQLREQLTAELEAEGSPRWPHASPSSTRPARRAPTCATRDACCAPSSARRPAGSGHAAVRPVSGPRRDGRHHTAPRGAVPRIEARARPIFAAGLLDEVRAPAGAGYGPELAPMSGHGYREAAAELAGEWTHEQAMADTVRRTRQYAKRQMTGSGRAAHRVAAAGDGPADDPALVERASVALRPAPPGVASGGAGRSTGARQPSGRDRDPLRLRLTKRRGRARDTAGSPARPGIGPGRPSR